MMRALLAMLVLCACASDPMVAAGDRVQDARDLFLAVCVEETTPCESARRAVNVAILAYDSALAAQQAGAADTEQRRKRVLEAIDAALAALAEVR